MSTLLALWLLAAPALAQDVVYPTEDAASLRFPDADTPGPTFPSGTKLDVLVREADRVRVMGTAGYGWLPVALVSAEPPERVAPAVPFDLEELQKLFQQQP